MKFTLKPATVEALPVLSGETVVGWQIEDGFGRRHYLRDDAFKTLFEPADVKARNYFFDLAAVTAIAKEFPRGGTSRTLSSEAAKGLSESVKRVILDESEQ